MMCPNLKNPQVAQEFNELVQAVGEKAAYDIWNQNNGLAIDRTTGGGPIVAELQDVDNRIERVSNMILNKLLIKSSVPYNSKSKDLADRISDLYYNITGLVFPRIDTNYKNNTERYNALLDGIHFATKGINLVETWKAELINLYNHLQELEKDESVGVLKRKELTLNNFLNGRRLDRFSEYDTTQQAWIKKEFPKLFTDNKFKTEKQAFKLYKDVFDNRKLKRDTELSITINKINYGKWATKKKIQKIRTLIDFATLTYDYKDRIYNKLRTEAIRYMKAETAKVDNKPNLYNDAGFLKSSDDMKSWKDSTTIGNYFDYDFSKSANGVVGTSNTYDILYKISKSDHKLANTAKGLLKYAEKHKVLVNLTGFKENENQAGAYHVEFGKKENGSSKVDAEYITIDATSDAFNKNTEVLLMHETVHSLTSIAIHGNSGIGGKLIEYSKYLREYYNDSNTMFDNLGGIRTPYGLLNSNPSEFVSEFFTNESFINLLKNTPAMETSKFENLFTEILNFISNFLFGTKSDNAYTQLLPVMSSILDIQSEFDLGIQEEMSDIIQKQAELKNLSTEYEYAPNGKPSKLFSDLLSEFNGDRNLAIQAKAKTFSKSFKTWFGESKVIDENGEPLMVYHGSEDTFKTFSFEKYGSKHDEGVFGKGHYFTSNRNTANNYGGNNVLYPVFLSIRTPFNGDEDYAGNVGYFKSFKEFKEYFKDVIDENRINEEELATALGNFDSADGVIIHTDDEQFNEVVALNSNQIKSATENVGSFSTEKNNIYMKFGFLNNKYNKRMENTILSTIFDGNQESRTNNQIIQRLLDLGVFSTKRMRNLAKLLMGIDGNTRFVDIDTLGKDTLMQYNEGTDLVELSVDTFGKYSSVESFAADYLHEVIHHYTSRALSKLITHTKAEKEFASSLEELLNEARKSIGETKPNKKGEWKTYGLTNVHEFASEMLTNSEFRNKVYFRDQYGNTLWGRFKALVAKLINMLSGTKLNYTDSKTIAEATDLVLDFINVKVGEGTIGEYHSRMLQRDAYTDEDVLSELVAVRQKSITSNMFLQDKAKEAKLTIKDMKNGIKSKIASIRTYKNSERMVKELEEQYYRLSQLDESEAMLDFVQQIPGDLLRHEAYVIDCYEKIRNNGTDDIDNEKLMQFKHDYIGFYHPLMEGIKNIYKEDADVLKFKDEEEKKRFGESVHDLVERFNNTNNMLKSILSAKGRENLRKKGIDASSPTIDSYVANEFIEKLGDIGFVQRHIFSAKSSSDEVLRAVYRSIVDSKNEVSRTFLKKANDLKLIQRGTSNPTALYELDSNGKRTGYLVRKLNYGQFRNEQGKFMKELNNKYHIEPGSFPTDSDALIAYRKEKNEWLSQHAERRFTPEYYDIYSNMSIDTEMARNELNTRIYKLLNKVTDADGKVNREDLSYADWYELLNLYREKKALSSMFHTDGTIKSGMFLDIANNLRDINKKIQDKLKYKSNIDKFNEVYEAKKIQYASDKTKLDLWYKRNTRVNYAQEFWDALSDLEKRDYGKEYDAVSKARTELLGLYRNEKFQVEIDEESLLRQLRDYDTELVRLRSKSGARGVKSDMKFSDIAIMELSDKYLADRKRYRDMGKDFYDTWYEENHYRDERGMAHPYSYYTYIKPKNKKLISIQPSEMFQEIDESSIFFNGKFDTTDANTIQPKKELYDNSKQYDKVMSNTANIDLHKAILQTMQESNSKIPFLANRDPHMLAQISGNAYNYLMGAGVKGLTSFLNDKVTINNDDADYATTEALMRPDKSKLKFVPTHYVRTLDEPSAIASDIVGITSEYFRMAENYRAMSELAPVMETILEAVSQRKVILKETHTKKAEEIIGSTSHVYTKLEELLSMHLYGEVKKELLTIQIPTPTISTIKEITKGKKPTSNITLSVTKILQNLASYSALTMLGWNIHSAGAGVAAAKALTLAETLSNRFFGPKDYSKAVRECTFNLPGMLSSIGSNITTNKVVALMELFGITVNDQEVVSHTNRNRVVRIAGKIIDPMAIWSLADVSIKSPIMVAIMMNHKLVNNKFINRRDFIKNYNGTRKDANRAWNRTGETLYDAFEMKNGKLQVKDEYKDSVSDGLLNKVKNVTKYVTARIDGMLNEADKTSAQNNALLRYVFMFRSFMISNWEDRLIKKRQWNYLIEDFDEAQYPAALKAISKFFKTRYQIKKGILSKEEAKRAIPYHQKYAFKKSMIEIGQIIATVFIGELLKMYADKYKDNFILNYLAYIFVRLRFELSAMYKPNDLLSMLKSLTPVTTLIDTAINLFDAITPDLTPGTSIKKEIVKGPYKGWKPWQRDIVKLTPFKNIMEWNNTRAKLEWYESQMIKKN